MSPTSQQRPTPQPVRTTAPQRQSRTESSEYCDVGACRLQGWGGGGRGGGGEVRECGGNGTRTSTGGALKEGGLLATRLAMRGCAYTQRGAL
eukprot:249425-Chlamydomonas_euryale.AAC.6